MASVSDGSGDSVSLNIMPMLDVFSILILFLLMNFSTDPMSHDLNQGLELPYSAITDSLDEKPTISITRNEITVNDKKLITLVNGKLGEPFKQQGGIQILFNELKTMAEANRRFTKETSKANVLTMEIDKDHKFELIKRVMLTAQQADFIKFKLMVSKEI